MNANCIRKRLVVNFSVQIVLHVLRIITINEWAATMNFFIRFFYTSIATAIILHCMLKIFYRLLRQAEDPNNANIAERTYLTKLILIAAILNAFFVVCLTFSVLFCPSLSNRYRNWLEYRTKFIFHWPKCFTVSIYVDKYSNFKQCILCARRIFSPLP